MGSFGPLAALIVLFLFAVGGFVLYVWSIVWAYRDAEKRGKEGILVALLVALLVWPVGLIVWVLIRPDVRFQTGA
jgi:hypothetical protein